MDTTKTLRARRACSLPALTLLVCACSGGAQRNDRIPIAPGSTAEVVYQDEKNRLTLRSAESVGDATYRERGLYGETASADVKLADRETMQALVSALDALGLFARGSDQVRPDARAALIANVGGKQTVWSQPRLLPENMAELERFNTARMAFLQLHNDIISYHTGRMSGADLDRALAEQRSKNQEAVQNMLRKARGQGQ